MPVPQAHTRW